MARFQFRLQRYLSVKEQIEAQKEIEYAAALRAVEEEKEKLRALEDSREGAVQGLRKSVSTRIMPIEIKRYNNTIERLKQMIAVQLGRLASAREFAERKRLELVEAMKERKAIEKVRENAFEEYLKEEDRAARLLTDELTSYKYATK